MISLFSRLDEHTTQTLSVCWKQEIDTLIIFLLNTWPASSAGTSWILYPGLTFFPALNAALLAVFEDI